MDTSIIKLILLIGAVLLLSPVAYVLNRPIAWTRPAVLFLLAISAITLHYFSVQYSINSENTLSLLNGMFILLTAIVAASAFSPATCLTTIRKTGVLFSYPIVLYLLILGFTGNGYDDVGNFVGFTENSNMMGGYLALLMFPVFAQCYLNADSYSARALPIAMTIAVFFLIFTTASRASLLAILCGVAFVALTSRNIARKYRILIIAGVLVSPLFLSSFIQKNEDLALFATRALLYQLRFEAISESPWVGWGLAADVSNNYDRFNIFPPQEKGNTILQLMEEFGVTLGTFFALSITVAVISIGRRLAKDRSTIWISIFLVASWVHSMFETWMFNFQAVLAIVFWLTFTLAAFQAELLKRSGVSPRGSLASLPDRTR